MMRAISCTIEGWMPSEGSSSRISAGSPISTRPMASCCCWPPDIVPAALVARAPSGSESSDRPARSRPTRRAAADRFADQQVLRARVRRGKTSRPCGT